MAAPRGPGLGDHAGKSRSGFYPNTGAGVHSLLWKWGPPSTPSWRYQREGMLQSLTEKMGEHPICPPNLSSFYPRVVGGRLMCSQMMFLGRDGPKSREGESFTGVFPQEGRKRLPLVGNRRDHGGAFGAVSDFWSAETPWPEGSQEERQSWGETQTLTKSGSAELCIWGREEKRLRRTKILKTAAGAFQAPEFLHCWVCPSGCAKVPEPAL